MRSGGRPLASRAAGSVGRESVARRPPAYVRLTCGPILLPMLPIFLPIFLPIGGARVSGSCSWATAREYSSQLVVPRRRTRVSGGCGWATAREYSS
eukprot:3545778-Pyramimonas_sp.AAC.1